VAIRLIKLANPPINQWKNALDRTSGDPLPGLWWISYIPPHTGDTSRQHTGYFTPSRVAAEIKLQERESYMVSCKLSSRSPACIVADKDPIGCQCLYAMKVPDQSKGLWNLESRIDIETFQRCLEKDCLLLRHLLRIKYVCYIWLCRRFLPTNKKVKNIKQPTFNLKVQARDIQHLIEHSPDVLDLVILQSSIYPLTWEFT